MTDTVTKQMQSGTQSCIKSTTAVACECTDIVCRAQTRDETWFVEPDDFAVNGITIGGGQFQAADVETPRRQVLSSPPKDRSRQAGRRRPNGGSAIPATKVTKPFNLETRSCADCCGRFDDLVVESNWCGVERRVFDHCRRDARLRQGIENVSGGSE
jgi:hypothetical protein